MISISRKVFFSTVCSSALLITAVSAQAQSATQTPITFYNNTNIPVTVYESMFSGGMMGCKGNPFNLCIVQQPDIIVQPHSTGVIELVTAVKDGTIHQGSVGFTVQTDGASLNDVFVGTMATPAGAFALANDQYDQHRLSATPAIRVKTTTGADVDVNTYAYGAAYGVMPGYVVTVIQNISTPGEGDASQTAVLINSNVLQK